LRFESIRFLKKIPTVWFDPDVFVWVCVGASTLRLFSIYAVLRVTLIHY